MIAVDEGMSGEAPDGGRHAVIPLEILAPQQLPVRDVQAPEVAFGTQRVDPRAVDSGCAAGPGRVRHGVVARVLMLPQGPPRGRIQAPQPLLAFQLGPHAGAVLDLALFHQVVHHKHPPRGDGRSGVTQGDRHPPFDWQAGGRKAVPHARLAPHAVPLRTQPLRPVIGDQGQGEPAGGDPQDQHQESHPLDLLPGVLLPLSPATADRFTACPPRLAKIFPWARRGVKAPRQTLAARCSLRSGPTRGRMTP